MTDQPADPSAGQAGTPGTASPVVIPDDLRAQHPDLIDLILRSESMNDEERQYWINILPIMTPEQLQNLRDILTTERQQLAAIDTQYAQAIDSIGQEEFVRQMGEERQRRSAERTQAERSVQEKDQQHVEHLLKNIEGV